MSRNKLRVQEKLDCFLDFRELINSKSKTRKPFDIFIFRHLDTREKNVLQLAEKVRNRRNSTS